MYCVLIFLRLYFVVHGEVDINRVANYDGRIQDTTFKIWLRDTVSVLKENSVTEIKKHLGLKNIDLIVDPDSLSLEVLEKFEVNVTGKISQIKKGDAKNVLRLLQQYREVPKGKFRLTFSISEYFYPSTVKELIHELLFEIKNLQIVDESGSTYNYSYIRGRIDGKTVTKKVNGKTIISHYNFIWDNARLIKEESF